MEMRFGCAQVRVKCAGPKPWFCRVKSSARICAWYPRHMFFPNSQMAKSSGKRMVMPFVPHGRWQRLRLMATTRNNPRTYRCWDGSSYYWTAWRIRELRASGRVRYRPCASIQRHTERRFPCRHRFSPFFTVYAPFTDRFPPFLPFSGKPPEKKTGRTRFQLESQPPFRPPRCTANRSQTR